MQLQGAFYFDLQGKITVGSEAAVRALTIVKRLDEAGLIGDTPGVQSWPPVMKAGKLAVAAMPAWVAHYLEKKIPDQSGNWRLTKPPAVTPGGKRTALVNSTHLAVAASSPRRRAAWKFVEYTVTRPASVNAMFNAGGVFPGPHRGLHRPAVRRAERLLRRAAGAQDLRRPRHRGRLPHQLLR